MHKYRSVTKMLAVSALVLMAMSGSFSYAKEIVPPYEFEWQLKKAAKGREGVSIYIYDVPDHDLHAFKGQSEVPYPPLHIINMMMDIESMKSWVYRLKKVKAQTDSPKPKHVYMAFTTIWPVKARDVGVESYIKFDPATGVVDMYTQNTNEYYPPNEDYVRIPQLYNHWQLMPLEDGWTRVEFETFVDFGGKVPLWIINMVSSNAPKKTFKGLRKQMIAKDYAIESVDELPFIPPGLEEYSKLRTGVSVSNTGEGSKNN